MKKIIVVLIMLMVVVGCTKGDSYKEVDNLEFMNDNYVLINNDYLYYISNNRYVELTFIRDAKTATAILFARGSVEFAEDNKSVSFKEERCISAIYDSTKKTYEYLLDNYHNDVVLKDFKTIDNKTYIFSGYGTILKDKMSI